MLYIDKINQNPKQNYTLTGPDREQIRLYIYYMPSQQLWFFDIETDEFAVAGLQLGVSPNCLRNYKNLISFGLACVSADGLDPMYITDFALGRIQLYLLSRAEVLEIEESFFK